MIFACPRKPAAESASMVVFIEDMVTVSSADRHTRLARLARTASTNFSGATSAPRSVISNPPPSSMEATMFFPISWRSPFTVPITTRPAGSAPLEARSGRISASAAFMARAARRSSGTK